MLPPAGYTSFPRLSTNFLWGGDILDHNVCMYVCVCILLGRSQVRSSNVSCFEILWAQRVSEKAQLNGPEYILQQTKTLSTYHSVVPRLSLFRYPSCITNHLSLIAFCTHGLFNETKRRLFLWRQSLGYTQCNVMRFSFRTSSLKR
jgi:hypothetical protein